MTTSLNRFLRIALLLSAAALVAPLSEVTAAPATHDCGKTTCGNPVTTGKTTCTTCTTPQCTKDPTTGGDLLAGSKTTKTCETTNQTILDQLRAVLAGMDQLQVKMDDVQAACAPADLLPVALPGSNPPDFCREDGHGNLVVEVKNQGLTNAPASTLRVTFTTPTGPVPVDVPTPALAGGGAFIDLAVPIPSGCLSASTCPFQVAVDVADVVVESDNTNNNASGVCNHIF